MYFSRPLFFVSISAVLALVFFSCTPQKPVSDPPPPVENTLKSVSFFQDSISSDPSVLAAALAKMNVAIDSIGFPDAGYTVWEVKTQDSLDFRIMVEGNWPDQETYDLIHDHELYQAASEEATSSLPGLKRVSYHRFNLVK